MALDTTVLAYKSAQDEELLAILGYNLKMGGSILQKSKRTNADTTPKGTKNWRSVGVLQGNPKFPEELKTFKAEVGGIIKTMASVEYGRNAQMSAAFIAPTLLGQSIANKSQLTIVEPTSPVTTTCDGTTPTDLKYMSIKVAAVTGFTAGDNILVTTGDSAAGDDVEEEPTRIKKIDATNKIIYFEWPIFQLPVDDAPVRKFVEYKQSREIGSLDENYQWRVVRYFHTNNSLEIDYLPNFQQTKLIPADFGDGTKPAMYGIEGEIIASPVLNSTTGKVEKFTLYDTYTILGPLA